GGFAGPGRGGSGHLRAGQPARHLESHAGGAQPGLVVMNPTPDNSTAIEVFGLTKVYGRGNTEVVAMKDVSLRVAKGEVIALLGPSGAGKSTLLAAIGLINPPTSGRIVIGDVPVLDGPQPLVNLRAFRRQHLGFVFQKANL